MNPNSFEIYKDEHGKRRVRFDMNTCKQKCWAFTSWKKPETKKHLTEFLVWQREVCPNTNRLHWQGCVEFTNAYSGSYVKSLFKDKGMFVEPFIENKIINIWYCTKTYTFDDEYYCLIKGIETKISYKEAIIEWNNRVLNWDSVDPPENLP